MKKYIASSFLIVTLQQTYTFDMQKSAQESFVFLKEKAALLVAHTSHTLHELKNDFKGAGRDAQEIAQEAYDHIHRHWYPVIQTIVTEIKDPFLDLPDVVEEIQETYQTVHAWISSTMHPITTRYYTAQNSLYTTARSLGINAKMVQG